MWSIISNTDIVTTYKGQSNIVAEQIIKHQETLSFTSNPTFYVDGEDAVYLWKVFGYSDGIPKEFEGKVLNHTFTEKGAFLVELTVKDKFGFFVKELVEVKVKDPSIEVFPFNAGRADF